MVHRPAAGQALTGLAAKRVAQCRGIRLLTRNGHDFADRFPAATAVTAEPLRHPKGTGAE
jgi:hypothetical protein